MNIENAKIAIDKMAAFLPDYILNDLYKDHNSTAHIISKDDSKVVFSVVFNEGEKRILTVTVKRNVGADDVRLHRHEVSVHYNGNMQVFSKLINAEFYSDIVNVLFPEDSSGAQVGVVKTISKTFNVHSLSDLSESAKQTAIDAYRNDENYPYDFWFEHSVEDFHAILSLLGFSNIESGFSGFCSQGDGANFTGSYTYKKGALKALLAYAPNDKELYNIAKTMQNIQSKYFYKIECELSKTSRYDHAYTVNFDFTVWNAHGTDEISMSRGDEEAFKNCFIDLMNWYYKALNSEYDYLTSDECIIENIESNDCQYLECGKQYF